MSWWKDLTDEELEEIKKEKAAAVEKYVFKSKARQVIEELELLENPRKGVSFDYQRTQKNDRTPYYLSAKGCARALG